MMRIPFVPVRRAWSPVAMVALALVAWGAAGCGGGNSEPAQSTPAEPAQSTPAEPTQSTLGEKVQAAMAQTDYHLHMTGPFGDGTTMSLDVDHVAPDRWLVTEQGDCETGQDEQIIIGQMTYWHLCDEQEWHVYSLSPDETLVMTEIFHWPSIYLSAVLEPQTAMETQADGTEVIALTGDVDCETLLQVLAGEGYDTSGSECPADVSITMSARIRAEDFVLIEAELSPGDGSVTYSYSDFGQVPPIVEPSPLAPTPTPSPSSGPLPTPTVPPATPQIAP
jgi:sarcosine oxidase gamma subunit